MKIKLFTKLVEVNVRVYPAVELSNEDKEYVELNNTYLQIERGQIVLTAEIANRLEKLVYKLFYAPDDVCGIWAYWMRELEKLPGWFKVMKGETFDEQHPDIPDSVPDEVLAYL